MKKLITTFSYSLLILVSNAQLTYVPDDVFEAYIETYVPNSSNGNISDNYVNTAALNVSMSLDLVPLYIQAGQISDLTGISDFTNLTSITISAQAMTTINLSSLNSTFGTQLIPFSLSISNCQNLLNIVTPIVTYLRFTCENNQYLENINFQNSNIIAGGLRLNLNNSLQSFDISNTAGTAPNVFQTQIMSNQNLTCLNLKNGGCSNYLQVLIGGNGANPGSTQSALTCVTVDNPSIQSFSWSWTEYVNDPTNYSYSTNCPCTLGLEETTQAFTLSPNPVSDLLNINIPSTYVGEEFHVYTAQGEEVQQGVISSNEQTIRVDQLPSGVYFFSVDGMLPERIVKL